MDDKTWKKIERVADLIAIPDNTVRTWRYRGEVPGSRHREIVEAAREAKIKLSYEELNQGI